MRLLIDAGNTRVKLAWVDDAAPTRSEGAEQWLSPAITLLHADIPTLPGRLPVPNGTVQGVFGVNVAGASVASALAQALANRGLPPPRWVLPQACGAGVVNAYTAPSALGPDRWAAIVGVAHLVTRGPVLLASFGTATTVDTVAMVANADGVEQPTFCGGLILPGCELMAASLATGTANLPRALGGSVPFPANTHQAISSGILAAQAGAVLRQWQAVYGRFGVRAQVLCTGGAWAVVADEVQGLLAQFDAGAAQWVTAPVLDGLARLAHAAQEAGDAGPRN